MSKLIVGDVETNSINGGPLAGFRNAIINGNFDHWQRGVSGTSSYVSDRWRTFINGSTAAISRQAFTLGQTDVPNEPEYFHRVVATSAAGAGNLVVMQQPIEYVRTFAGQTVTLSFFAKADAAKNIAVEFVQNFGTGGSPSDRVTGIGVTTLNLTTTFQKFTVTVAIPSIAGKTLGTSNTDRLQLSFFFDAGSDFNARTNSLGHQSGTFDIAQVQLEAGSVATPFERRPVGTELALCQRYYFQPELFYRTTGTASNGSQPLTDILISFPVTMRTVPSLNTSISNVVNVTGDVVRDASVHAIRARASTTTTGIGTYILFFVSADAEL